MSGDEWQKGLREECRVKMQGVEIKEGEGAEVAVLFPSTLAFRPPRHPTLVAFLSAGPLPRFG